MDNSTEATILQPLQVNLSISELQLINTSLLFFYMDIVRINKSYCLFEDSEFAKATEIEARNIDLLLAKLIAIVKGDDLDNETEEMD